jgi:RNA polymerase sigma factor (sigma-70 family)
MEASPVTRASLLIRLQDPSDQEAWQLFVDLYAPLIYGFLRKRGLQDADAADLMQEVLRSLAVSMARLNYDPRRGTFRGWLYTVTRNKLSNFLGKRNNRERGSGDSGVQAQLEQEAGADPEASELWEQEYQRRAFAWAAEQVREEFQESTWHAFWLTAVEGQEVRAVSAQLGLSPGAIYVAKSRVLARLREQVQLIETGPGIPD